MCINLASVSDTASDFHVLKRALKTQPALSELFATADDQLFLRVNGNSEHVLQTYMPEYATANFDHNLRPRRHSRQLITKTNMLNNNDFIIRMLYKDIY